MILIFKEKKKFFLLFFPIAIIILGLASLKNINTFKKTFYYTSSQIYDGEKFYFFSKRHTGHYKTALNIFSENFLIGAGPKSFRYECKKFEKEIEYACSTHPHNFYLQSLSEIGIFGFIFILSIFFIVTYSLYKLYFKTNRINDIQSVKIIIIFIVFKFISFNAVGNMFNNYLSMSFVIMLTNFYIFYKFKIRNDKLSNFFKDNFFKLFFYIIFIFFFGIYQEFYPFPVWDSFDTQNFFYQFKNGNVSLKQYLFGQHNEHIIILNRLLIILDYYLFNSSIIFIFN